MFQGVKPNFTARVHADLKVASPADLLDGGELAMGNVELLRRRGERHAIACRERAFRLAKHRHTCKLARIVNQVVAVLANDSELVFSPVHSLHARIFAGLDAQQFAAPGVADQIAFLARNLLLVVKRPSVCPDLDF